MCECGLSKKAEPPPTRDVNRDSGTASANGGWLRRLVRRQHRHNSKLSASTRLSDHLRHYGKRLLSHRAQIINLDLATGWARKLMPLLARERDLINLAALVVANRHWHWKTPIWFHNMRSAAA